MAKSADRDEWTQSMLRRAELAFGHDTEDRRRAKEHYKFLFVPGNQWDQHMRTKRPNKPCYEFNILRPKAERLIGQQLKNKPQIKVRPVEDNDVETADVYNGLIKNIEVQSHAEIAYDTAFRYAVGGGFGVLRVTSDYESDDSFEQCLKIGYVDDPASSVFPDPAAKRFDWSDMEYCFVVDRMAKESFKKKYPDADMTFTLPVNLDQLSADWCDEATVRVAEYWWKEPYKKKIHMLSTGEVVEAEEYEKVKDEWENPPIDPATGQPSAQPKTITQTREVDCHKIYSCLVSGSGKLSEKTEWNGTMIPIVPQWGNYYTVDGKTHFCGMTAYAADAQRLHNFMQSTAMEVMAKLPNSPLMATAKQIEGLESYYERMGYDDPPVLLYNGDPAAPGSPQRQPMGQFPAALVQMAGVVGEEIKSTTGIYDASVGAPSNESSGRAIIARQNEADLASFVYIDNQMKALKRLGEILVDSIPRVYDTERSIRILGEDGAEDFVQVNQPMLDQQTGDVVTINDLGRGRYDVVVTVGKAFDTMRMEMAEVAQALSAAGGPLAILGQYMLIKSLDVPGMDEFVKPMRDVLVKQGLLEPTDEEKQQMAQQASQPDPMQMAQMAQVQAQIADSEASAQQKQSAAQLNQVKAQQIMMETPAKVAKTQSDIAAQQVSAGVSVSKAQTDEGKLRLDAAKALTDAENAAIDRVVELNNRSYPVY